MKKHWLTIAVIGIAVAGLVGWMLSNNLAVAMAAALLMFVFGVGKPLIEARKSACGDRYTHRQFDRAESRLVEQAASLIGGLPKLALPLRSLQKAIFQIQFREISEAQLGRFDEAVALIESNESSGERDLDEILKHLELPIVACYLKAVFAYRQGNYSTAAKRFQTCVDQHAAWADAWFGLLRCEYLQGNHEFVLKNSPQLNGVEWLPFAPGDQDCFLALEDHDRDNLVTQFLSATSGIGDLYTAASEKQSRDQVSGNRQEFRDAA